MSNECLRASLWPLYEPLILKKIAWRIEGLTQQQHKLAMKMIGLEFGHYQIQVYLSSHRMQELDPHPLQVCGRNISSDFD